MDTIDELLKAGITAIKSGQKAKARQLLLQAIEADDKNERAWLWLSGAVEADEEKRICLENVLTINPDNELARKGLAKLAPAPLDEVTLPGTLEARAAQLTHNESGDDRGWWTDTKVEPLASEQAAQKFDDVWSSNNELCAYCAHPVTGIPKRCPNCNQSLIANVLIDPIPSRYHGRLLTWMIVYLTIESIGVILLLLLLGSLPPEYAGQLNRTDLITQALTGIVPTIIATVGVYQRQLWAYWLMMVIAIVQLIQVSLIVVNAPNLFAFICVSPILFLVLFIVYSIYMSGGDFKRHKVRRIAGVSSRLKDPVQLDRAAQKLAKEELWGSAVLHWQRAVARASGHAPYLLRLGHAYAKLGFYERSLDVLKPALEAAKKPEVRQQIEKEIVHVTRLSNQ